eukprot:4930291-Prorocentrum_lima.AAC.1
MIATASRGQGGQEGELQGVCQRADRVDEDKLRLVTVVVEGVVDVAQDHCQVAVQQVLFFFYLFSLLTTRDDGRGEGS